ncbi:MAG TPA: hypothetical protein HA252_02710 [Candidatus Diapherotrites archaeon]|uniref:Uncharacterized protein n=1 Tax=Candidatus Iainarchaeum sp. TaxID=3101447 RepID=A0A7J4JGN2_9ARCH|nr:hypothetical protein [Candidatus Diapherotrites archaeon]HIH16290.1 hypothetical protein [Candidatus Diapherotrites archaeon]
MRSLFFPVLFLFSLVSSTQAAPLSLGPAFEFADAQGTHSIPLYIRVEASPFDAILSFDRTKTYVLDARVKERELIVSPKEPFNGVPFSLKVSRQLVNGKRTAHLFYGKTDYAQPYRVLSTEYQPLDFLGMEYMVTRISRANTLTLLTFHSISVCQPIQGVCVPVPPFQASPANRFYLSYRNSFDSLVPTIQLTGQGNLKFQYTPVVVRERNQDAFYLLLDARTPVLHSGTGQEIRFLGSDLDGDGQISKYEPAFAVIPGLNLSLYKTRPRSQKTVHALFSVKASDNQVETLSIPLP